MTYAENAKNVWKLMKNEFQEHKVKSSGPWPFAHLKAKPFVNVVKDLATWLLSIDAVQADFVSARRLSSSLALLGFTHWSHLEGGKIGKQVTKVDPQCY